MNFLSKVFNFSAERYLKTAGDLFIYEGDCESALYMVEKTLEIEPDDVRALVLRGDILYCLNRDLEALDTFNHVLTLNPDSVEALISKAGVLDILGKYREALECCTRAFTLIKSHQAFLLPCLYDQNIALLLRLKHYRKAQQLLKEAGNYIPKDEHAYLVSSYSPILERLTSHRRNVREKAKSLSIEVLENQG